MKRNPVAWAALVVSTAALISSTGVLRPMPAAPKVSPEGQKVAAALSQAYEAVAEAVKPSAVLISVKKKSSGPNMRNFQFPFPGNPGNPGGPRGPQSPRDMKDLEEMLKKFFGPEGVPQNNQFGGPGSGVGSGFVYDDQGHILTNNHVIEGAEKITVGFHDGIELPATVVGADDKSDVAVIKVDSTNYPALLRGDSRKLKVGDLVMAVGSPFELSQSVTTGIISATERNNVRINDYESFLQTDAAINPGNSGGPLVNMAGEVVGVNSAIVTGGRGNDGIGFAIPIDMAQNVADQLIKDGKVSRSRIGIKLDPLTPVLAKQLGLEPGVKGILVGEVVDDSPAAKSGLKQGDVIIGWGGETIPSLPAFRLRVASSPAGREVAVEYYRDGERKTATIVPAPAENVVFDIERQIEKKDDSSPAKEPEKSPVGDFGLEVQPLTPELAKSLGLPDGASGLLVSDVKENSPAEAEGLKQGDVITKVLRDKSVQPVGDVKSFQELAAQSEILSFYVQSSSSVNRFVSLSKTK
ncbi:trypsin-like peptidase domain-containing protein [Planctomyces sp. SH-PL62]|uniref:trypsin-like peptidase domain-containing protein n=1 Tax=Planctomyces sp. SH-PL62 TaxID=1636152 RepID=UPI00078C4432|nr:trypsin-like peptidase domain-containing protein [Planctomyces sp. SH-PL62]AMV39343.1 putative periplasmic serine endoprotease DegP-like precursor [Planctomyces sp. SH-PL62]